MVVLGGSSCLQSFVCKFLHGSLLRSWRASQPPSLTAVAEGFHTLRCIYLSIFLRSIVLKYFYMSIYIFMCIYIFFYIGVYVCIYIYIYVYFIFLKLYIYSAEIFSQAFRARSFSQVTDFPPCLGPHALDDRPLSPHRASRNLEGVQIPP